MRVLRVTDAAALASAYVRNRAYLAPWEPVRPEEYFTEDWQSADIVNRLVAHEAREAHPRGLFDGDRLVGRFNVEGIVRGPFQSAGLGYWVDGDYADRGLASAGKVPSAGDHENVHRILGFQDKAVAFVEASGRAALENVEPEGSLVLGLAHDPTEHSGSKSLPLELRSEVEVFDP